MVLGTGWALSDFFRREIIAREGVIIGDLARAMATRGLQSGDLDQFGGSEERVRLASSFGVLQSLSEVVRIKVFNRKGEIAWSDDPALIGTWARRPEEVGRAVTGANTIVFYEDGGHEGAGADQPPKPLVEVYAPILVRPAPGQPPRVMGVMALYRSAETLNATLDRGVRLVWSVTAFGGAVLFVTLFTLFRSVHRRHREAESQLSRLGAEHQRVVQLEKLSAVGQMIGEVAHQVNSPLVGVMNLAQLAEREADDPVRVRQLLGAIGEAGEHCRTFVRRMLDFTKVSHFERQKVDVGTLVDETVALFLQSVKDKPGIQVGRPDFPALAFVDPILVRHALFNLLSNAAQADPSGRIEIALAAEEREVAGWSLAVVDHGPGVPPEVQEDIFTPFFTTRPGGVGLGLSVVEHIVIQHGGAIAVDNPPGGGARFVLWLPDGMEDVE
ncbi:MAG: HAMP domain-containing histidine kinase [Magnetospirillum gryphiswaldense]|nr:HAMP domain-containing histidine kinase [Magnetospirillum gryphiswaldense]